MNEPAIEVKDVHVRYRSMKSFSLRKSLGQIRQRRDSYEALRGVSFTVPKGKIIGIIGKNGSGKTNILEALNAVVEANSVHFGVQKEPPLSYKVHILLEGERHALPRPKSKMFPSKIRNY